MFIRRISFLFPAQPGFRHRRAWPRPAGGSSRRLFLTLCLTAIVGKDPYTTREIVVEATRFCRPFGARLLGSRFIMDVVGKRDAFRSVGAGALAADGRALSPIDSNTSLIRRLS